MDIFSFSATYPDEETCRKHFKEQRDKNGVKCNRCGHDEHYWVSTRWQYQCKKCKSRQSLRSGTVMQHSNLPFLTWYKAIFLMTMTKKGLSALELQRQLGMKRYEPVWYMMHKLRDAMGRRDARYTLSGEIEMDEGYFTVQSSEDEKLEGGRGRAAAGKQNVAIMAESTPLENPETGKNERQCRYFKAKVLDDHKAESVDEVLKKSLDETSIVFTDKSTSYVNIEDYVEGHICEKSDEKLTKETLQWVHICISNAKRNFLGIYHSIKGKYLQAYLDEFVYKLNRRYFGAKLFDRLIIAGITAFD